MVGPILTAIDKDWLGTKGWPTEPGNLTKVWVDYTDDEGYSVTHKQPPACELDDPTKDILSDSLAPPSIIDIAHPGTVPIQLDTVAHDRGGPAPLPSIPWE